MAEDTSLSWEGYLERKESIGSTENDQIIIPIMWFKQTARMQWSFYKKMLLSGNVLYHCRISLGYHPSSTATLNKGLQSHVFQNLRSFHERF